MSLIMDAINKAGVSEPKRSSQSAVTENQKSSWSVPSERFFLSSSKESDSGRPLFLMPAIFLLLAALVFLGFWHHQRNLQSVSLQPNQSIAERKTSLEPVVGNEPKQIVHGMDGMPFFRQAELQGVLAGKGSKSLCIISGRIFKEEDSVEGYRIESIGSQGVVLRSPQGETVPLALNK